LAWRPLSEKRQTRGKVCRDKRVTGNLGKKLNAALRGGKRKNALGERKKAMTEKGGKRAPNCRERLVTKKGKRRGKER